MCLAIFDEFDDLACIRNASESIPCTTEDSPSVFFLDVVDVIAVVLDILEVLDVVDLEFLLDCDPFVEALRFVTSLPFLIILLLLPSWSLFESGKASFSGPCATLLFSLRER